MIGKLPVQMVDTALVTKVLEPIWLSKPETASRVRGRIESVLDWATVRQFRIGPNPAQWSGHLEHVFAAPKSEVKHHPALPYREVPVLMARLRQETTVQARALEFIILTAARLGETLKATWSEIDLGPIPECLRRAAS